MQHLHTDTDVFMNTNTAHSHLALTYFCIKINAVEDRCNTGVITSLLYHRDPFIMPDVNIDTSGLYTSDPITSDTC